MSNARSKGWFKHEPGVFSNHGKLSSLQPRIQALRLAVVLVSMLRDPAERCLSQYYHFVVSIRGERSTTAGKLRALRSCHDMQFDYLARNRLAESVDDVWSSYAFLGVTRRYLPSAVMLARTCGGVDTDALHVDSKIADGRPASFSSRTYNFTFHPALRDEPSEVRAYVGSEAFRGGNSRDLQLIQRAEARVAAWEAEPSNAKALRKLEALQKVVATACDPGDFCAHNPPPPAPHTKAHVQRQGQGCTDSRCLWNDNGCGFRCIDQLALDYT